MGQLKYGIANLIIEPAVLWGQGLEPQSRGPFNKGPQGECALNP